MLSIIQKFGNSIAAIGRNMLDAHSKDRWGGMNLIILRITCLLLVSVMANGFLSYGRDCAVHSRFTSKESDSSHEHKILNQSPNVGNITYKLKRVSACGTSFLNVPPGTYCVVEDMEIYNGGRSTVRVTSRAFEIRTDAGRKFQSGVGNEFNLKSGQSASCMRWLKETSILTRS